MPLLELGGWPDQPDGLELPRLLAVMLFPEDQTRREEFLAWAREQANLYDAKAATQAPLYRALDQLKKYFIQRGLPVKAGELAGHILITLRRLAEHHADLGATLTHAKNVVSRCVVSARSFDGRPVASSPRTLHAAWASHRNVAHLWAGHGLLAEQRYRIASRDGRVVTADKCQPIFDELPLLLALAESMRAFGEGHDLDDRSRQTRAPALDPSATWRCPAEFVLPEIDLMLPSFSPVELDAVS